MMINVVIDSLRQLLDARLQPLEVLADGLLHRGRIHGRFQAIGLLLVHVLQRLQPLHQRPELTHLGRRGLPGRRLHGAGKVREQRRVSARSVLLRAIWLCAKPLTRAGLTTLTNQPSSLNAVASASSWGPVASRHTCVEAQTSRAR